MKITYLSHSGFALETENHFLIFDYYRDTPKNGGLEKGVIDPKKLPNKPILVFASHHHGDHFNPVILEWKKVRPDIHYILSDDIEAGEKADKIAPAETKNVAGIHIVTLPSTDEGVAFLVEDGENTIYHAGDLNDWNWKGEGEEWQKSQRKGYRAAIQALAGKEISVAFLPLDPRLAENALDGVEPLLETAKVKCIVPMHLWSKYSFAEECAKTMRVLGFAGEILCTKKRGDSFIIGG